MYNSIQQNGDVSHESTFNLCKRSHDGHTYQFNNIIIIRLTVNKMIEKQCKYIKRFKIRNSDDFVLFKFTYEDGFGGLVVSMLASGTQICGFKPGRSR